MSKYIGDFEYLTPGQRLKLARLGAGFDTPNKASEIFGVTVEAYRFFENGTRVISKKKALHFGMAFKVNHEWILTGQGLISEDESVVTMIFEAFKDFRNDKNTPKPLNTELVNAIHHELFKRQADLPPEHFSKIFCIVYEKLCEAFPIPVKDKQKIVKRLTDAALVLL